MIWEDVVRLACELPGVESSTSYGTPALKVNGKLLTRLRPEDSSIVLMDVGFDEREILIEADPATFHLTAHYQNYRSVLARLAPATASTVRHLLERRWRNVAPKRFLRACDQWATVPRELLAPPKVD